MHNTDNPISKYSITVPSFNLKSANTAALLICAIISIILLIASMAIPSKTAEAKSIAEIDQEITQLQGEIEQVQQQWEKSKESIQSIIVWQYKHNPSEDFLSFIFGSDDVNTACERALFLEKLYDEYEAKMKEAETRKGELEAKTAELESLKAEMQRKIEAAARARQIQFPQAGIDEWSGLPYWTGTVASAGCGLCAYTVMVDALTGSGYTPRDMLGIRGDWKGMDGYAGDATGTKVPGMSHREWTEKTFDIKSWEMGNDINELATCVKDPETVAILCLAGSGLLKNKSGQHRNTNGHFIAVTAFDEDGFHISDSAYKHSEGADIVYSIGEMNNLLSGTSQIVVYSNKTRENLE